MIQNSTRFTDNHKAIIVDSGSFLNSDGLTFLQSVPRDWPLCTVTTKIFVRIDIFMAYDGHLSGEMGQFLRKIGPQTFLESDIQGRFLFFKI